MNNLLLYHHLGLGDHITLSPLVRHLVQTNESVSLVVKPWYLKNVKFLYRDLPEDKLSFVECPTDYEAQAIFNTHRGPKLKHFYQGTWINEDKKVFFEDGWYTSVGLDKSFRKENFHVPRDSEAEAFTYDSLVSNGEYIFVHDDPSRGYNIEVDYKGQVIRSHDYPDFLVFDFMEVLERAKEVHVMYSSFFALMEMMDKPCYLHETALNKVNGIAEARVEEFKERGILVV